MCRALKCTKTCENGIKYQNSKCKKGRKCNNCTKIVESALEIRYDEYNDKRLLDAQKCANDAR